MRRGNLYVLPPQVVLSLLALVMRFAQGSNMPQAHVQLVQNQESDESGDVLGILVMTGSVKEMGCRTDMSKSIRQMWRRS